MKKNIIISLIAICIISFSIAFTIYLLSEKQYMHILNQNKETYTEYIDLKDITNLNTIDIECDIADIYIINSDRDDIQVTYEAYTFSQFNTDTSDNKLSISTNIKKHPFMNLSHYKAKLTIELPNKYRDQLNLSSNCGNVDIDGNFSTLKVHTDVGNSNINGHIEYADISSNTGNIKVFGTVDSANIESDVGNIKFSPDNIASGSYACETNMGNIYLSLPDLVDFQLSAHTDLGEISYEQWKDRLPKIYKRSETDLRLVSGNGETEIDANSDIGNINIMFKFPD